MIRSYGKQAGTVGWAKTDSKQWSNPGKIKQWGGCWRCWGEERPTNKEHNPHKSLNPITTASYSQSTPQSSSQLATPSTFSFTPLTKPVDEAGKKEERVKDEEKAGKKANNTCHKRWHIKIVSITVDGGEQKIAKMPVFGENLSEKFDWARGPPRNKRHAVLPTRHNISTLAVAQHFSLQQPPTTTQNLRPKI